MLHAVRRAFVGEGSLTYRQGATLVLVAGILFSFTALLFRAVERATEWQFILVRSGSMAAVLLVVVFARRHRRPVRVDNVSWRTVLAGFLLASMSMLFILALARTTAAMVTFLLAAAPFSGAFFGWVVLRERVSAATVVAILAAIVGVGTMVGTGIEAGDTSGVLLAALIPVILGLYNVLIRSSGDRADPLVPGIVSGMVLVVVAGVVSAASSGFGLAWGDILLGFTAGGLVLGIGLPLFNLGHRSVPTVQVSLLNLTEIVLTPVWVWIWPGEIPRVGTMIGGAIVLAAVVYLVLASDRALRFAPP